MTSSTTLPNPQAPALSWRCALPQLALLKVSGADALTFLHGQLTNEVKALAPGKAQMNGFCTAKGRLLGSFIHWNAHQEDGTTAAYLLTHASLASPLVKRLSMFVLRAKAKVQDVTASVQLVAYNNSQSQAWTTQSAQDGTQVNLPGSVTIEVALNSQPATTTLDNAADSPAHFDLALIQAGLPLISDKVVEQFVPQMVNFELIGGVSFSKGCYPGQEVVARSHYRGTTKRRMFIAQWDSSTPAEAGALVHDMSQATSQSDDNVVGQVVSVSSSAEQQYTALIELQLAQRAASLQVAGSTSNLAVSDPPYPLELPA